MERFDELPEDQSPANGDDRRLGEELRNMAWWDTVGYEELENWIPTLGRTPRDVHHGLALFRGAVCRDIRRAREAGDAVAESRACKLLTFMDRLVLTATRGTRGDRKHKGSLSSRARRPWSPGPRPEHWHPDDHGRLGTAPPAA